MQFGLSYTTPELFGVKNFLTIHGGWLAPKLEFIDQPLSAQFVNAAMVVADGIGGNVPFSAAFSSWGGTVEVKPADWQYTKVGLFMSYPEASDSNNNGLMFQGYAPDVSQNGLWFMGETGFTPHIGGERLPGKYAFGAYLYENGGGGSDGNQFGLYLQADQMLFREFRGGEKLSAQGLNMFSLISFAPPDDNPYPLYAQGGLSYEGAVPTRDKDKAMFGFGFAPLPAGCGGQSHRFPRGRVSRSDQRIHLGSAVRAIHRPALRNDDRGQRRHPWHLHGHGFLSLVAPLLTAPSRVP
jgi:porin